jgi:hypothetical protein
MTAVRRCVFCFSDEFSGECQRVKMMIKVSTCNLITCLSIKIFDTKLLAVASAESGYFYIHTRREIVSGKRKLKLNCDEMFGRFGHSRSVGLYGKQKKQQKKLNESSQVRIDSFRFLESCAENFYCSQLKMLFPFPFTLSFFFFSYSHLTMSEIVAAKRLSFLLDKSTFVSGKGKKQNMTV